MQAGITTKDLVDHFNGAFVSWNKVVALSRYKVNRFICELQLQNGIEDPTITPVMYIPKRKKRVQNREIHSSVEGDNRIPKKARVHIDHREPSRLRRPLLNLLSSSDAASAATTKAPTNAPASSASVMSASSNDSSRDGIEQPALEIPWSPSHFFVSGDDAFFDDASVAVSGDESSSDTASVVVSEPPAPMDPSKWISLYGADEIRLEFSQFHSMYTMLEWCPSNL